MKTVRAKRPADVVTKVYQVLHERAINFDLRPGEHVNEQNLARELNVSRTPIREALTRLASEGLLTLVPNRGFYSRPIELDDIRSLFELRIGLEIMGVKLATQRASDDDLALLAERWTTTKRAVVGLPMAEVAAHDEAFHEALVALSRNTQLPRVLRDVNARIRFVRIAALENPISRSITFVEHDAIIAAVRARDEATAASLIEGHITLTLKDIEQLTRDSLARIYLKPPG